MSRVQPAARRTFDSAGTIVPAMLLVAPSFILAAAMFLLPARGPASAAAQNPAQDSMPLIVPPVPELTPEQELVATAMRSEAAGGFKRCPVVSRAPQPEDRTTPAPHEDPSLPGKPPTPPDLTLTSIMLARGEPMAMISRKLRRVGDEVAPGWRIERIDPSAGVVAIGRQSGQRFELRLRGRAN